METNQNSNGNSESCKSISQCHTRVRRLSKNYSRLILFFNCLMNSRFTGFLPLHFSYWLYLYKHRRHTCNILHFHSYKINTARNPLRSGFSRNNTYYTSYPSGDASANQRHSYGSYKDSNPVVKICHRICGSTMAWNKIGTRGKYENTKNLNPKITCFLLW